MRHIVRVCLRVCECVGVCLRYVFVRLGACVCVSKVCVEMCLRVCECVVTAVRYEWVFI